MLYIKNILSFILVLPLIGAIVLSFIPASNKSLLRSIALNCSCLTFVLSLFLWVFFNKSVGTFQFAENFFWIPILNLNFSIGVDGISLSYNQPERAASTFTMSFSYSTFNPKFIIPELKIK